MGLFDQCESIFDDYFYPRPTLALFHIRQSWSFESSVRVSACWGACVGTSTVAKVCVSVCARGSQLNMRSSSLE